MLEEAEARSRILAATTPAAAEFVSLDEALGAFAAQDLLATVALPGFDNSQMDGYAVRAKDAFEGARLTVVGEQAAGPRKSYHVGVSEAVRIFTGAPMPEGADAVVMQEDTEVFSKGRIRIREGVEPGEFIRRKGSDLCVGQRILAPGDLLNPARIGVIASQGLSQVQIRRPAAAVVTTGDELVLPGVDLTDGGIYNSNGPMLSASIRNLGVTQVSQHHAPDEPGRLAEILDSAISSSDVCVIAGGVSVGEHDHVKAVLAKLGVDGGFWRVRVKPGKPLFFGHKDGKLVFGLPGNPVSAYITFLLFVAPAIRQLSGAIIDPESPLPKRSATLTAQVANDRGNRPHYVRGFFDEQNETFQPIGLQQSHALYAMSRTNALVRVDAEQTIPAETHINCFMM